MQDPKIQQALDASAGFRLQIFFRSVLTGLVSGLMVSLFRLGVENSLDFTNFVYHFLPQNPEYILPWVALALSAALLIGYLVRWEPMAGGGGLTQVKAYVVYAVKFRKWSVLLVRYVAGILAAFFGISLGREGPSIQIGAVGGMMVSDWLAKGRKARNPNLDALPIASASSLEENYLLSAGAAAGLSAAFNAPLAGLLFTLEEVHRSFSPTILMAAATGALTADITAKYIFGLSPFLYFRELPTLPTECYIWLLPLGLASGLAGALTNKVLLNASRPYKRIPPKWRPLIAISTALACVFWMPEVLGGGRALVEIAIAAATPLAPLALMLAVKLAFTCICFGGGLSGGVFLPILSIGALSGAMVGQVATMLHLPQEFASVFAVCGMAGALTGAVKSPLSAILLAAEMSGSLSQLMPVAATCLIALLVSDGLRISPLYESLMERLVNDYKNPTADTQLGSLREYPVETGSPICWQTVAQIPWPRGCVLAKIRRGDAHIAPEPQTMILPGDYLCLLTSGYNAKSVNQTMLRLCLTPRS